GDHRGRLDRHHRRGQRDQRHARYLEGQCAVRPACCRHAGQPQPGRLPGGGELALPTNRTSLLRGQSASAEVTTTRPASHLAATVDSSSAVRRTLPRHTARPLVLVVKTRLPRLPSGSSAPAYASATAVPTAVQALIVPSWRLAKMTPKPVPGVVARPRSPALLLVP